MTSLVERAVAKFGRSDAAFNTAGVHVSSSDAVDQSVDDYDRSNGINLPGIWVCMEHKLEQMQKRGGRRS